MTNCGVMEVQGAGCWMVVSVAGVVVSPRISLLQQRLHMI